MLFKFDETKVTFKKIKMKSISTTMGGVLFHLDEVRSTPIKEVFTRIKIPAPLALLYKKLHKTSQYLIPQEVCLMLYDNKVVAVEKHITNIRMQENLHGDLVEWESYMEINLNRITQTIKSKGGDWYFDGSVIYQFDNQLDQLHLTGDSLTIDGKFKSASVAAYRVAMFFNADRPNLTTRQCLVYSPKPGITAISPPVWSALGNVRRANMKDDIDANGLLSQFDNINEMMAINLNFALIAGDIISKQFGYRMIEPLQLPKLMVQLKTVNLPNLATGVKSTYDIGMPFMHGLSWLMGLLYRSDSYEDMLAISRLLKYITSRGIFRKDSIKKMKKTEELVPLYTREEALTRGAEWSLIDLRLAERIIDDHI